MIDPALVPLPCTATNPTADSWSHSTPSDSSETNTCARLPLQPPYSSLGVQVLQWLPASIESRCFFTLSELSLQCGSVSTLPWVCPPERLCQFA
jgi:hypothetical protein